MSGIMRFLFGSTQRKIIVLTLVSEGILLSLFFLWQSYRGPQILRRMPNVDEIVSGASHALLLAACNIVLLRLLPRSGEIGLRFQEFIDTVVWPLAKELSVFASVLVAVMAGVGEEFFFRGMLQTELGILLSSVLFALMHFGTAAKKFYAVVVLYALISLYVGLVFHLTASIWTVVFLHAIYDFLALLYLRFYYHPRCEPEQKIVRE